MLDSQILPHNLEAEQGLLGSMMISGPVVETAADLITPEDFYAPAHQRIAQAIFAVTGQGRVASPVTLRDYFQDDPDLTQVGGAQYLAGLAASVVTTANTAEYCRMLRDLRLRRGVIAACDTAAQEARQPAGPERSGVDVVEGLEHELFALAERGSGGGAVDVGDQAGKTIRWIEQWQRGEIVGVPSGIAALDRQLRMVRGDLVLLAGRPSMGKSVMAMTLAHNFAAGGVRSRVFSLEMSSNQLIQRMLARHTGFPVQQMMDKGGLKPDQFRDLVEAREKLRALPLSIDDRSKLAVAQIRSAARREKRLKGLDVVIIDYLGLMDFGDRYVNKVDQIGEVSKALKAVARELDIVVILLSQLSRAVEGRESKRPGLSDLRDSGSLEQDADIVMFLYREEYYLRKAEPVRRQGDNDEKHQAAIKAWQDQLAASCGQAEIIIDKFRQGQTGIVKVGFDGVRQWFHDLDY